MNPPKILILTVGTGTSGAHSNLAAGLLNTLKIAAPEAYRLIPSASPDSVAIADLVREGYPGFEPWDGDGTPYRWIEHPDSLENCRAAVRDVIAAVRRIRRKCELIVNPTSGTKQMSVGAALAALDEGIGVLEFTVGRRADGVVMTGTEKIERFDAARWFADRDLQIARNLVNAGAHAAAADLLARHPSLSDAADTARCLHEWERQNYSGARAIAAGSSAAALVAVRHHLTQLATAAKDPAPQPLIVADLLQTADQLHRRRDFESSLTLTCRALEMGLRCAFDRKTGLHEPYSLFGILALNIDKGIKDRCAHVSRDGQRTILNLSTVAAILQQLGDDLGDAYYQDRDLQNLVRARNDLIHQLRAVSDAESQGALQRTRTLLEPLRLPQSPARPALRR